MNTKYTKQQIKNAIDYWTRQLNVLNESKSAVIDELISEFGENIVTSKTLVYKLNELDLKKIFQILNKHLFDNKLPSIDLKVWPDKKVADKLNENALKSKVFNKHYDSAPCYGVLSAVCSDVIENGNIKDIDISEEIIMMNNTYLTSCVFIFAVACICHEMIHLADRFTQEFHDKTLHQSRTQIEFDSHKDQVFQDKMFEANENGIHVVESIPRNQNYNDANNEARYVLSNVLDDEETDTNVVVVKTPNQVMLKNTKTGTFTFAIFD